MKNIWTIASREIKSYFISPVAYVVITLFLLIAGYFFSIILFITQQPSIAPASYNIIITFLLLIPLLCMRLFSEEKKSGTIEVLLTKPVRDGEVVLGKFLAALIMVAILLGLTFFYILLIMSVGQVDWPATATVYLGMFLLGMAFVSLGLFASALTKNQIIAAVLGFVFLLLMWLINAASSYIGSEGGMLDYLALSTHFSDFVKGVIDLRDVVYYLSFSVFFLYLTVKILEMRNWK